VSDTARLEKDVQRAKDAADLLQNRLLLAAFTDIEAEIIEQMAACPQRDKDGQVELNSLLKLNRRYRNLLQTHIETGKVAAVRLSRLERLRQQLTR
jgi:hypothetical protein